MGVRSDVAIALKNNVLEGLSAESKKTLDEWFGQTSSVTKEGVLFYEENIKWYSESYDDLIQLYAELIKFDDLAFMRLEQASNFLCCFMSSRIIIKTDNNIIKRIEIIKTFLAIFKCRARRLD